jgi:ABC-type dipeptide/oligopeptide/nickel transport system permease subunit
MAERVEGLKASEFVLAARAHGIGTGRVVLYHLAWANGRGLVLRHALTTFSWTMAAEASLSYLGDLGVQEPAPSWGNMIAMQLGRHDGNALAWIAPALLAWTCTAALATAGSIGDGGRRG